MEFAADIYLQACLAGEMAGFARSLGASVQGVFNKCVRLALPKILAEFRANAKSYAFAKKRALVVPDRAESLIAAKFKLPANSRKNISGDFSKSMKSLVG